MKDLASGNFNPFVNDAGGIGGIDKGPTEVQFGSQTRVAGDARAGEEQLGNYRDGFMEAKRLTNEWAKDKGLHRDVEAQRADAPSGRRREVPA